MKEKNGSRTGHGVHVGLCAVGRSECGSVAGIEEAHQWLCELLEEEASLGMGSRPIGLLYGDRGGRGENNKNPFVGHDGVYWYRCFRSFIVIRVVDDEMGILDSNIIFTGFIPSRDKWD
jgi:hypothetical protein